MGACASRHSDGSPDLTQPKSCYKDDQISNMDSKNSLRRFSKTDQQQQGQQQRSPAVQLAAEHLLDDTLGEVLSQLPLNHLVQLSCCSKRLHQLVCQSDKVLRSVDLRQLQPHQLESALLFLAHHPAADSIQSAIMPSNCHNTTAALTALTGLHHLEFYYAALKRQLVQSTGTASKPAAAAAAAVAGPPPDLAALPLQQLSSLQTLTLSLESGDIRAGQRLRLPADLKGLVISAPSLGSAINPLDLQNLRALSSLQLHVLDASSSTCLAKLVPLHSLRDLCIEKFHTVPDVMHHLTQLSSVQVGLCSQTARHAAGDGLQGPLRAAAHGLMHLPTRPNMQLQVHVTVLAASDGLASDWGTLHNLRSVSLSNIYPMHSGGFTLSPLGQLGRLTALQLGFEGQQQVQGQQHDVELIGLHQIIHLRTLVATCTGAWLDVIMEPPPHLTSLVVACNGRLQLVAPGHAVAAAAAAAAAALHSTPPPSSSTASSSGAQYGGNGGSSNGSRDLTPVASWPPCGRGTDAAAAAAAAANGVGPTRSLNLAMLYDPHMWQQQQQHPNAAPTAAAAGEHSAAAAAAAGGALDTAAVMMMQRKLDRLGSIEETAESYIIEDEAQQLQHIHKLGLLAGRGIYIQDAAAAAYTGRASLSRDSSMSSCSRPGSIARGSMTGKLVRRLSLTRRDEQQPDVLSFDDWLAANRLSLAELGLVRQQLPSPAAAAPAATLRRSSSLSSNSSDKAPHSRRSSIGRRSIGESVGSAAGCNVLLVRQNLQDELMAMFQQLGFL